MNNLMAGVSWSAWPCRRWPSTREEESRFWLSLRSRSRIWKQSSFSRTDVTAVTSALRGGAQCSDLFDVAPGLRPANLAAAYWFLKTRLEEAHKLWASLRRRRDGPSELELTLLQTVLPLPVARIRELAPSRLWKETFTVEDLVVKRRRQYVDYIFNTLKTQEDQDVARMYGLALYGAENSLFSDAHFLAARVGELVPLRISGLLGEDPSGNFDDQN